MSVARAQSEISSMEFAEWMAFDRLEPLGDLRADYHAALIAKTISDYLGDGKNPRKLEDFLLDLRKLTSEEQLERQKQRIVAAFQSARRSR